MELHKATATYGKLHRSTLSLHSGFQLIYAPNESGKSTWVSFLLSMLYGLPTRARGSDADKNKYAPWSGALMEGSLELSHHGQEITVTRSTQRVNAPMGQFAAVYAHTATPYPNLTGDNCGETLLGVPRDIYLRSGIFRQTGLSVDQTPELQKRITGLMTTGEETISFSEAQEQLKKALHRRQYHKTGTIPQLEEELHHLAGEIAAAERLNQQIETLETQLAASPAIRQQETPSRPSRLPFSIALVLLLVSLATLLVWQQPMIAAAFALLGLLSAAAGAFRRKPAPTVSTIPDEQEPLRQQLAFLQGQRSAGNSLTVLRERKAQLEERLQAAQQEYGALALAMETLQESYTELNSRFAPTLGKLTESFFTKLTNGKYNKVLLRDTLEPSAGEEQDDLPRQVSALSKGAQEQLYLALRLALADLLLPEDAPLILDDAFVHFDDQRLLAALSLLMEQAGKRQILYFTCQKREEQLLRQHFPHQYHAAALSI